MTKEEILYVANRRGKSCLDVVQEVYKELDSRTCKNCKHKEGGIVGSIHCAYFEQYLPVEIGKCDKWESKDV